jgi:signal transduction histidine kinase
MTLPMKHGFPKRIFLIGVGVVCLGLALTAWYGYRTLSRLRTDYLNNRGHEIGAALDGQMRGPMRRNNPDVWQSAMQETLQANGGALAFIALFNQSNTLIASAGYTAEASHVAAPGFAKVDGSDLYIFEMPLMSPRQGAIMGFGSFSAPARLRIGMRTGSADFIERQAVLQATTVSIAIFVLIILALVFLRTISRFLELEAREQSERQLRYLGTMSATLAHEIRNPLGAIKGLTQLAQEDLPSDHDAQLHLKTVVKEAERLERLVTDLLTFARPFRPQYSRFDFVHLLSETRSILQPQLDAAGISLEIAAAPPSIAVDSDESGLRQVLLNTLLNAMDVTPKGGSARASAVLEAGSQHMVVEIDDDGPGLGERDPEELFQPFETTKIQGTGLGLAVSRQIIEKLGGSLSISNRTEGGARCRITIPVTKGHAGNPRMDEALGMSEER